jgi:pimeloyl-ACP methyl ester carboxylesterase
VERSQVATDVRERWRAAVPDAIAWLLAMAAAVACHPSEKPSEYEAGVDASSPFDSSTVDPAMIASRPSVEVGFIELEQEDYFMRDVELTASAAHFFYSFQPASNAPESAPLLVFNAGGPAAAVMYLISHGSGPYRIAYETEGNSVVKVVSNPHSLTAVANLLYLDARNAGFSYCITTHPEDRAERQKGFTGSNYNVFRDAADLLRALLAFLRTHPNLAENPVYFVAESYGAMRTTVMTNQLLFHRTRSNESALLQATALEAELDDFFEERFGNPIPEPERVAEHFRGQILLQPWLAGSRQSEVAGELLEQPNSPLDRIAEETGIRYLRCSEQTAPCDPYSNAREFLRSANRSAYDYRKPADWLQRYDRGTREAATRYELLQKLLGVSDTEIKKAFRTSRLGAYRYGDVEKASSDPSGNLEQLLGALEPWDKYFVLTNQEAQLAFFDGENLSLKIEPTQALFGELFLENIRYVETFISRAQHDLVIYAPALAPTFQGYPAVTRAGVVVAEGSDQIVIDYADGTTRRIVAPSYPLGSHLLFREQAAALQADIADFLLETQ